MEANLPNRVVVPTYNEADNLEPLTAAVFAAAPNGTGILVVDDASPDGTGELADELAAGDERITVLHRAGKEGLGPAYVAGHQRALALGAERVVQMDADFSHDPADVPRLIAAAEGEGGADLVLGSRYVAGGGIGDWGVGRQAISRWGSTYARFWLGISIRDLTGGFKCFRRKVLETIDLSQVAASGYSFQVEMTWRVVQAGFSVMEVPITFRERQEGDSKMTTAIVAEAAWRVPAMRIRRH